MQIRRADIVIVEPNPTTGCEQRGTNRPCAVIQNDVGNTHSPTTIVAPFTTQYDPEDVYPFEVEVAAASSPFTQDSVADLSQIRVVDVAQRVKGNIGSVQPATMASIDAAIEQRLGL